MTDIEGLARRGARGLGSPPTGPRLARQRQRIITALAMRQSRPKTARLWLWIPATGALAAGAVALLLNIRSEATTSFWVGAQTVASTEGALLRADKEHLPVRFSDGSLVELLPESEGRVRRVSRGRVEVALTRGTLRSHVRPGTGMRWSFACNRYTVRVTGTKLTLGWNDAAQQLSVEVDEGLVMVRGPGIAGEMAVGTSDKVTFSEVTGISHSPAPATRAAIDDGDVAVEPPTSELRTPRASKGNARSGVSTWHALADDGDYAGAYALARRTGWSQKLRELPARDLAELADVARYAGDLDAARAALNSLERRFPRHPAGHKAIFLLARIAAEDTGDLREAARGFQRYLDRAPEGPFAQEALGRRLEALFLLGDFTEGPVEAQRYLDRYPQGAHANVAKRLLGKAAPIHTP